MVIESNSSFYHIFLQNKSFSSFSINNSRRISQTIRSVVDISPACITNRCIIKTVCFSAAFPRRFPAFNSLILAFASPRALPDDDVAHASQKAPILLPRTVPVDRANKSATAHDVRSLTGWCIISWNCGKTCATVPAAARRTRERRTERTSERTRVGNSSDALCIYRFTYLVGNYFANVMTFSALS